MGQGSRFAVHGLRFTVHDSQFTVKGSRFAEREGRERGTGEEGRKGKRERENDTGRGERGLGEN